MMAECLAPAGLAQRPELALGRGEQCGMIRKRTEAHHALDPVLRTAATLEFGARLYLAESIQPGERHAFPMVSLRATSRVRR
jgi:hypothetical protein